MPRFHDLATREDSEEFLDKAEELGWNTTAADHDVEFLDSRDWGELKKNIQRSEADILIYQGGDDELHKKVAEHGKVDIIMSPENSENSGIDHVIAEAAAENNVAIGFNLQELREGGRKRSHVLKHWRRNLRLCEKYDTMKVLTTGATETTELRAPRDAASIIDSLGFKGKEAVSEHPGKIIGEVEE